jgi:hypothetical protein
MKAFVMKEIGSVGFMHKRQQLDDVVKPLIRF